MGWCRECDHTAVPAGHDRPVTFASVEFYADDPPDEIAIAGERYVREAPRPDSHGPGDCAIAQGR